MSEMLSLRHLAEVLVSNVDKTESEGERAVRLCNYVNVYHNDRISSQMDYMTATATAAQVRSFALRAGDSVITKDSETPDDIGVVAFVPETLPGVVCGYHLAIVRPRAELIDAAFLYWALRSVPLREQLAMAASGVTRFGVTYDALRGLGVPCFADLKQQQVVAHFLGDQVTRIDLAIESRRKQLSRFAERDRGLLTDELRRRHWDPPSVLEPNWQDRELPANWRIARLSQVLDQLTNGYVGPTRDILQDKGVRYLQSLHIKDGRIDFSRRPFFVSKEWHLARPRIALRPGDVLIVQTGDLGQVAVVPDDFGPASCHALLIARTRTSQVLPQYLSEWLRSHFGRHLLLSRATGALHPHLEGSIRDVPVLLPPLDEQRAIASAVTARRQAMRSLGDTFDAQIRLLNERKRALITAAVTGEFDVTTAGPRAAAAVIG